MAISGINGTNNLPNGNVDANVNGSASATSIGEPRVIILWVHPRSCSTMFECAFLQRQDEFRVLHEPMGDPFYFGPERMSVRYSEEKCKEDNPQHGDLTFMKQWQDIVSGGSKEGQDGDSDQPSRVFVKDMAQYIIPPPTKAKTCPPIASNTPSASASDGNPTVIPTSLLLDPSIIHTFLFRTPEKAVPSYYRLCSGDKCEVTGFHYFDKEEVGLKELRALYEFIKRKRGVGTSNGYANANANGHVNGAVPTPNEPLLIDSADLLANPVEVMKLYCERVGVEFRESMLSWKSGTQEHFKKWKGFHDDAQNSTGINRPGQDVDANREALSGSPTAPSTIAAAKAQAKADAEADAAAEEEKARQTLKAKAKEQAMPKEVRDAIEENMEDYEWLRERAIKI